MGMRPSRQYAAGAAAADFLYSRRVAPHPTATDPSASTQLQPFPCTAGEWWLSIASTSGTARYVLCFERSATRATRAGSGGLPARMAAMFFRWLGQIRNQALHAMIVPNTAPRWIHTPRGVNA